MKQRSRKFTGTLLTVAFMIVYALVAMAIEGQYVVGSHGILEFIYFVIAGLLWVPVVMAIIKWMVKPDLADIQPPEAVQQGKGNT